MEMNDNVIIFAFHLFGNSLNLIFSPHHDHYE